MLVDENWKEGYEEREGGEGRSYLMKEEKERRRRADEERMDGRGRRGVYIGWSE